MEHFYNSRLACLDKGDARLFSNNQNAPIARIADLPALSVPVLVPKPGSPTVTQEHLPGRKSDALRALGLSWFMLDSEVRSLKIRVSVVD